MPVRWYLIAGAACYLYIVAGFGRKMRSEFEVAQSSVTGAELDAAREVGDRHLPDAGVADHIGIPVHGKAVSGGRRAAGWGKDGDVNGPPLSRRKYS